MAKFKFDRRTMEVKAKVDFSRGTLQKKKGAAFTQAEMARVDDDTLMTLVDHGAAVVLIDGNQVYPVLEADDETPEAEGVD